MKLLTKKQSSVLKSIDRFGVITSTQLIHFLKEEMSYVTVYSTKKILLNLGLIAEEKIGYHLLLYIRPRGVHYLGSDLTPFSRVNYKQLQHQLSMNDCLLAFLDMAHSRNVSFDFMTERELRSRFITDNFSDADRKNSMKLQKVADRVPDGIVWEDGKKIALEVELTQKSSKRYEEKLLRYRDEILNGQYRLVRYVCEDRHIQKTVATHAKREGFSPDMLQLDLIDIVLAGAKTNE
ncbi:hypothetical protein [Alkalihalobacillus sp. TS-13]|uniref:hypothetical protein n=1 Tax=Alkalihalobacillus sp. TS-13 TaxID=2842455 RepID=UPI001C886097|nr:hypothetical protein [Alkalihalobacillus sp. TS-13]